MQLQYPVIITPRLLPGVRVGGGFVSIEYAGESEGRQVYRYHIDLGKGKGYTAADIKSGVGGGDLRSGLESLLSFLGACAESYRYAGENGENSDLFPKRIAEWAMQNSDEITMAGIEIEETPDCIVE